MIERTLESGKAGEKAADPQGCLDQMEASRAWFNRRVLPLSLEQLRWRPGPHSWSIAECLNHLNITLALYLPKIEEAVAAEPKPEKSHLCQYEELQLEKMEPPPSDHMEAALELTPSASVDPDSLVDQFHQTRNRLADSIRRSAGLDLGQISLVNPLYPAIHSLGATFALLAAHDRRHIWQAERVMENLRFPASPLDR